MTKCVLRCEQAPAVPLPEGKRIPYGWGSVAIDRPHAGNDTVFHLPECDPSLYSQGGYFRLTVAAEVREVKRIEISLARSGQVIGEVDLRYGYVLQVFQTWLSGADLSAAMAEGLRLRMVAGELPLWIYYDPDAKQLPSTLQPHVLPVEEVDAAARLRAFREQLKSLACLQSFGWLGGCVMDALWSMEEVEPNQGWKEAIEAQLQCHFPDGRTLRLENYRGEISDDRFFSTENTLPIAIIAELWPDHPVLERALAFWERDWKTLKTEELYTVAYPAAVLAARRNRPDLAALSVRVLRGRIEGLADADGLWLRLLPRLPEAERFYNWGRSYAWYMLGLIRSVIALRQCPFGVEGLERLEREVTRISQVAAPYQRDDGLWNCFIDEPDSGAETSGTAGIATALALGVKHGLLPVDDRVRAERAFAGLQHFLTQDGLLDGVAQNNRGGEALQRSGYRVISQMAMGLMGQLMAALRSQT